MVVAEVGVGGRRDSSLEYWRYPREDFGHDRVRNAFEFLGAAGGEIENAGLIAPDNTCGFCSGSCQGNGEAGGTREITAAGDRQNYRDFGDAIERFRRDDQHRTAAFLLVSRRGVETDEPDLSAIYSS